MIEILEASHGGSSIIHRQLGDYDSVDQVVADAAAATGVAPENILLFLSDGRDFKDEVLRELWDRGGDGSQSAPPPDQLFLFNRETFYANTAETWAAQYAEEVVLPLPLNLSAISDLAQAQKPFEDAYEHIQHLSSLHGAQARALWIAYASLASHLQPLLREFEEFQERARAELDGQDRLLRSSAADMAMLPKIAVHEAFAKKRDRRESGDTGRTMANYVNPGKMETVRDSCKVAHEGHIKEFDRLAESIDGLALHSDAERRAAEERANEDTAVFEEAMTRVEMTLAHLRTLFESESPNLSQDLMELDSAMREELVSLTSVKNNFTLDLHLHLRQVASFQVQITELVTPIHSLDSALQSKAAFPHLARLHQLPLAYATSIIEVVRRKSLQQAIATWVSGLNKTFAALASDERELRQRHKLDSLSQLPFIILPLENLNAPQVRLSITGDMEDLDGLVVDRQDAAGLLQWIERLKADQELDGAIVDEESNPIPALERGVAAAIKQMDSAQAEMWAVVQQAVAELGPGGAGGAEETKWEHENASLRRQLAEQQQAHQRRVQQMESSYDQRTTSLQNRQAELQDELVRLRTDLSEEMGARQALSIVLHGKAQEYEKTREDYSELVMTLQAELMQEKDRATDLGIRLQEALLDVDGLKSAEQSLIAQIQGLQDERSRLLQDLSNSQVTAQAAESQLAGVRAELASTAQQLGQTQVERDAALRNQTAEAERMMRDQIAEADGDRAVLEHQNLTLTKQVEDLRVEMEEKMSTAKNAAVRTADGLKAELSFTKAQLRELQRRETIMADQLAMAKDTATALGQKETHNADVTKDAVVLAARYHDTCVRLLHTINASSTLSGSTHIAKPTPPPTLSSGEMKDSALIRSLSTASSFDLALFAEAVNKSITLAKKFSKSCKHYRDQARNKISFTSFSKGDLALFLPTRNATTRPWMAFSVGSPHHFLKVPEGRTEAWKGRDSIIARITGTEEAVAGNSPNTNPFGLAEGLRFYIHSVDEYTPAMMRPPKRSVSTSYAGKSLLAEGVTTPRPSTSEPMLTGLSPLTDKRDEYFPPAAEISDEADKGVSDGSPPEIDSDTVPSATEPSGPLSQGHPPGVDPSGGPQPDSVEAPSAASPESPTPPAGEPAKLSPVFESFTSPVPSTHGTVPPPTAVPAAPPSRPKPPFAIRPTTSSAPRAPSRASLGSPTPASAPLPFTPATHHARPPSAASSSGSYTRPIGSYLAGKGAPAMAVTSSREGKDPTSAGMEVRRPSSELKRYTVHRIPSSSALNPYDDRDKDGPGSPPDNSGPVLSRESSRPSAPLASTSTTTALGQGSRRGSSSTPFAPGHAPSPKGAARSTSAATGGTSEVPGSPPVPAGGTPDLDNAGAQGGHGGVSGSKFWTIGRSRLSSMTGMGAPGSGLRTGSTAAGEEGKKTATAEELLKKLGG